MDANNTIADMADEISALQMELEVEVQGVQFIDGNVEELKSTSTDRRTPYARVRTFQKDAAAVIVLNVPQGRLKGLQIGQAYRLYVTPVKGNIFQYSGHQTIATASLARNAKPAAVQSKDDAKASIAKVSTNPKATL